MKRYDWLIYENTPALQGCCYSILQPSVHDMRGLIFSSDKRKLCDKIIEHSTYHTKQDQIVY